MKNSGILEKIYIYQVSKIKEIPIAVFGVFLHFFILYFYGVSAVFLPEYFKNLTYFQTESVLIIHVKTEPILQRINKTTVLEFPTVLGFILFHKNTEIMSFE